MRYVTLAEYGFPNILLWENGEMYDLAKDKERHVQKDGMVELFYCDGKGTRFRTRLKHLLGYYFEAPWNENVGYRSLDFLGYSNYLVTCDGRVFSLTTYAYLVGVISFDGYQKVLMIPDDPNAPRSTHGIHRLVALAFIPNPEDKPEVNHIDGNKMNNYWTNLEWVWQWENMEHAIKHGLRKSSITDDQIHMACAMLENGVAAAEIARRLNVPQHCIKSIKSGCHYRISKHYNIPRTKHF